MSVDGILKVIFTHLPKILISIILFSVITVIVLSLQGKYASKIELFSALILLFTLLSATFLKILTNKFWIIFLLVCYSLMMVMWGSYVPYIHLLPFLLILLLTLENMQALYFIPYPLLLILLETFHLLPLHTYSYEIGTPNSFIILCLLAVLLPIFSIAIEAFVHLSTLANHLSLPKSVVPFTQFLIKGIYASMMLHFTNNLINNSLWSDAPLTKEKQLLLELFANTSQSNDEHIQVEKVITVVCTYYGVSVTNVSSKRQLSLSDAQILLVSLFDLLNNYAKSSKYAETTVTVTQKKNELVVTITGAKKDTAAILIKTGRYLDYLKLYLKFTRKGKLTMFDTPENFTTQYRIITDVV